jgi:O-acetyl-ADP-ribose deacetylase (regulator of RNase III)
MLEIIDGNLLTAKEKFIAHQCNCLSKTAGGIAQAIFDKYPYANTYATRTEPNIPNTIEILGNGKDERFVINMYSQYYPGAPKYPLSLKDGTRAREKFFYQCLLRISKISNLESIAFPYLIGCGLGGGIWEVYLGNLTFFANHLEKQNIKVVLYRKD